MIKMSSKKIAEILCSVSNPIDEEIENISTDSRNIKRGDLFVAIRGEKFDGHDYVAEVLEKGACVVIVDKLMSEIPSVRQILVDDTLKAYGKIGAYVRSLYKGVVIGLTGSSGKTTLKEELKHVLKKFAPISATEGNFNNFIGVPRSLCDLDMGSEYAIIEMGMSAKGEISYLTSLVKPDIAIVGNVYPMHIEFFEDGIKGIAKAKAEIFEGLSEKGVAIVNGDAMEVDILKEKAYKYALDVVLFGKDNIVNVEELSEGEKVEAKIDGKKISYNLSTKGEHFVCNSLCVLSVVSALGLDLNKAAEFLTDFAELPGRGKHHKLKLETGVEFMLIDDSYSGQPEAMIFAIKGLSNIQNMGRKIALVGKMGELGKFSKEKHIDVGKALKEFGIDIVIGVGEPVKDALMQLDKKTEQYYFETFDGVKEFLVNKVLQNNDVLLIKGSHYGSQVYKVAEGLIKGDG